MAASRRAGSPDGPDPPAYFRVSSAKGNRIFEANEFGGSGHAGIGGIGGRSAGAGAALTEETPGQLINGRGLRRAGTLINLEAIAPFYARLIVTAAR